MGDLAFQTLWEGIVEDANLFLRYILEKLSNKDKQGVILRKLRRLMGHMNEMPPHAAATLFNHLVRILFMRLYVISSIVCQNKITSFFS